MDLPGAFEISFGEIEVLAHHAELDALGAQDVPNLAKHLLHAHIRSHVAGAVVSGKEEFQLFPGLPWFIATEHPPGLGALDVGTDPRFQDCIHHAALPPRAAGQG